MKKPIKTTVKFKYKGGSTIKADWYQFITPLAKVVGAQYGLPWQAISSQTALETGYGRSSLVQKYNNFGGIKDTDGVNSTDPMATKEFLNGKWVTIKDGFEIYPTPYEGLIAYAQFFHKNKRYAKALQYPNDPVNFIKEVRKAGYATDPNYVAKLVPMIKEAQEYAFTGDLEAELQLGSSGLEVERLQRLLNVYCMYDNSALLIVDGDFGPKTLVILKKRLKTDKIKMASAIDRLIDYVKNNA